ncbi:dihydroxyacetone kinase phosphoryl donor subunit DhaM [Microbacterium betulae]|uniref:Phosphocarrier protein HPr n=1 Tax=Microbacterium betulae TaxID=2981139 RepID=A0AA97FJN4_9MICO|nr:dihydroxyacetone kinase phosphoryl donor subunit DhaM [Microbacterium sp. AB]WOF23989.1 dihydroxyacetone kinase phosphoryl donor subunit DhaM [Microbacterium sp. AB]
MIAFVVVSHSTALAEALVLLAGEMARPEPPPIAVAAGTADGGVGTDAALIAEAIESVASPEGTLVFTDLGSAVMSAELAVDLAATGGEVRLAAAPLVEGFVAAVARAAAGGDIDEVEREARRALTAKLQHLGADDGEPAPPPPSGRSESFLLTNEIGLHARPAASVAGALRGLDAVVRIGTATRPAVDGRSLVGLMALGARRGDTIDVTADGPDADRAIDAIRALVESGFGE